MNRNDVQTKGLVRFFRLWPEVFFIGGVYGVLLLLFTLLRLALLWRNATLAGQVPPDLLVRSFLVGARFDLAISSYLLMPLLLALILLPRMRLLLLSGFAVIVGGLLFLGVAEIEFYREFESRFNPLVFESLGHPKIVAGQIWGACPVMRYTLLWVVLAAILIGSMGWFYRLLLRPQRPVASSRQLLLRIMGTMVALAMMVFFSRGGFGVSPLCWRDAFFCEVPFANHLAQNGIFALLFPFR